MKTLAPSKELLQGYKEEKISKEEYVELYLKQLKSFNGKQAIQELIDMAREEDVTLLCYEKNGDFCHRFILGEYLEKIFDIEVKIIK